MHYYKNRNHGASILGASIKYHCIGIYNDIHYTCHCLLLFFYSMALIISVIARYSLFSYMWIYNCAYWKPHCLMWVMWVQQGIWWRLSERHDYEILPWHFHEASLSYIYTQAPDNRSVSYQRLTSEPSSHISPSIFPNPNCVSMIQRYFKGLPSIPINIRTHPRFELLK